MHDDDTSAPPILSALIRPQVAIHQPAQGLWSVMPPDHLAAPYDQIASVYDRIIGNPLYNRIIWGAWPSAYGRAAAAVLAKAGTGPVLDCGCGSLVFTHHAYRDAGESLILFDRSLGMLQRGAARLEKGVFIQGDLLQPPFAEQAFAAVMCWGVLHLFGAQSPLLDILHCLVRPQGMIAISTLVLSSRGLGNRMLRLLHRKGEIAPPQTAEDVKKAFDARFLQSSAELQGNMLFLRGYRGAD